MFANYFEHIFKIDWKDFETILKNEFSTLENLNSYAIAVNEAYTNEDLILKTGDVVAIIPPVSGG